MTTIKRHAKAETTTTLGERMDRLRDGIAKLIIKEFGLTRMTSTSGITIFAHPMGPRSIELYSVCLRRIDRETMRE